MNKKSFDLGCAFLPAAGRYLLPLSLSERDLEEVVIWI